MDFKTIAGSFARQLLTVLGGMLVAKFSISCADLPASTPCNPADVGAAVGGLLLVAGSYLWSLIQKKIAARKLAKAVAAPAGQAE